MSPAIFLIVRDPAAPPVIRCEACKQEERYWTDRQASAWKSRHQDSCPQNRPRL